MITTFMEKGKYCKYTYNIEKSVSDYFPLDYCAFSLSIQVLRLSLQ